MVTIMHRLGWLRATTVLACLTLAACGGGDSRSGGAVAGPSEVPNPPSSSQSNATPPFNLTQDREFVIHGWDSWPSAPTPSAVRFRWNAATVKYEVLVAGSVEWGRLEYGVMPFLYDVFGSDGTELPYDMVVVLRSNADVMHVGDARIFEGLSARAYFAFGIATEPGEIPVSGTMTCTFGMDEIGGGELTFNLAEGTLSGWTAAFWADTVRYPLVQSSFAPGATTFAATFGSTGVLEGRFYGPGAVNVAVRAKGGASGIMTGVCKR